MRLQLVAIATVAVVIAFAAAVFVPPAPESIRLGDPSTACVPIEAESGLIYPASSMVHDSAEPVEHWFTGDLTCPRGFDSMHILVVRRPDAQGPPPKSWLCVRDVREFECPVASEPPSKQGAT